MKNTQESYPCWQEKNIPCSTSSSWFWSRGITNDPLMILISAADLMIIHPAHAVVRRLPPEPQIWMSCSWMSAENLPANPWIVGYPGWKWTLQDEVRSGYKSTKNSVISRAVNLQINSSCDSVAVGDVFLVMGPFSVLVLHTAETLSFLSVQLMAQLSPPIFCHLRETHY